MGATVKHLNFNSDVAKQIVEAITVEGLTPAKAAKKFKFKTAQVKGLMNYIQRHAMAALRPDWKARLTERAVESQFRGLEHEDSYKASMVGERILKGVGVFKGDVIGGTTVNIQNNNLNVNDIPEDEQDRLISLYRQRQGLIPAGTHAGIAAGSRGLIASGEDRCTVLGAELHQDVRSVVDAERTEWSEQPVPGP